MSSLRKSSCGEEAVRAKAMNDCRIVFVLTLLAVMWLPLRSSAQESAGETQGVNSGGYNIQQNIEFGYRLNEIGGNYDTYDTFVNLGSGMRLFDYTLDMRSLNHQGMFFDDLDFSNFGYGGDPNDVSRLHIDMNKVYDFSALFRRDENFWDYNLFANPLNPAALNPLGSATAGCIVSPPSSTNPGLPGYCSNPAIGVANSPHALDLVRRMQDYDLTLLPQSKIRFRLGFSHDSDNGPGFFTTDGGTLSDFPENYSYTTNAYRVGVDFRVLPRTTISYDQFLSYFKQDNTVTENPTATPQQYGYQANGVPVDLGFIWSTQTAAEALPCAAPIANATTTPPTANANCNGFVSYSQVGQPRDFMPTERLRFQSDYFNRLEMTGSFGYSSSDNTIPNFNETVIGWTTRTASPGGTTAGPAEAKRDSVDGDWSGVYAVTNNFRIEDFFHYNNWRSPGMWDSELGSLFNTVAGTDLGLGAPVGYFVAANCNASNNFSGSTCPDHTVTSAADLVDAYNANFLKQDMKSNSLEFDYDFSKRISGYIGYLYTHRDIVMSSLSYTTADIYYPGGATASAANDFLAARGSCALVSGALPAGCVLNADGSITFTPTTPVSPPTMDVVDISEDSVELGFKARPVDTFLLNGDFSFGYNNAAFTRIDPRQVQSYKLHATYTPKPWATVDGEVEIHENRDNVYTVDNLEHDRMYSFSTMLVPNPRLAVSFGYNYWDVYTQSDICFNYSITATNPTPPLGTLPVSSSPPGVATTACPIAGASVGAAGLGALSTYASNDHFAHADVMWKPVKRVTASLGYGGSFVRGNTIFLNPLTPSGTLDYNYQMPYGSIVIDTGKGFSYKLGWNYYGFNETGDTNPFGLAAIPLQDFNGSNITFSFRYSF
ncbi:MAG: hypothetical protein WA876_00085 [Candidatus Acidiferrales bacterium]